MPAMCVNDFRRLFSEREVLRITARVQIVVDDAAFVAENDDGGRYNYGEESSPNPAPKIGAYEWFGVSPRE